MKYAVSVSRKALRTIRGWPEFLLRQVEGDFLRVQIREARITYTVSEPEKSVKVTEIEPRPYDNRDLVQKLKADVTPKIHHRLPGHVQILSSHQVECIKALALMELGEQLAELVKRT